jgi:hypothetical protein
MNSIRVPASLAAALIVSSLAASPSMSDTTAPPFQTHVDMKTFMEHVLTPAALNLQYPQSTELPFP